MSTTLTPRQAWHAASGIYDAKNGMDSVKSAMKRIPQLRDSYDFENLKFLEGHTGAFIKVKSGFAVIAKGKTTGNKTEALVTIRGTDLTADWLTDANFGVGCTSTGKFVHSGFNRVFEEFIPHLESFFNKNAITTAHCVGHSLGGALANLTADWLTHNQKAGKAKLYTFGAPRVGFSPFATRITQNVKAENMFRVHHDNDFVSLVPLWPYCHTPMPGSSACIYNHGFGTFAAHKMSNYDTSLKAYSDDWGTLKSQAAPISESKEIESWLSLDTVSVISSYALGLIAKAVQYILKAAGVAGQFVIGTGFTVLDKISYALEYAWKGSKEVAGWVEYLLRKILNLVGRGFEMTSNITTSFIRWVFRLLSGAVYRLVNLALLGARET